MATRTEVHAAPVLRAIEREIKSAGGVRALARHWGISPSYVSDLRLGRRGPGPKVLRRLRLHREETRVVTYIHAPALPPEATHD